MTLSLILIYGLIFCIGPVAVLILLRRPAGAGSVRLLGVGVVALIALGLLAQALSIGGFYAGPLLLWASWIMSMALMGQVMRLMAGPGSRRWSAVVAAMGATIPWFGIVVARMMAE